MQSELSILEITLMIIISALFIPIMKQLISKKKKK